MSSKGGTWVFVPLEHSPVGDTSHPAPDVSAEEDYYEDDEEDDPDALTDPLYQLDLQVWRPVSEGLLVTVLAPVPVLPPQCPCSHPAA